MFQRTHLTTHLISEYTFTQTTGSSSSSENNAQLNDEATSANHDDLAATVLENATSVQADKQVNTQPEIPTVSQGSDNIRERTTYGSTDPV